MVKHFGCAGQCFILGLLVKRRRAMLASNPLRNSQPELIADDGQGMCFPACPIPWPPARPESGIGPRG